MVKVLSQNLRFGHVESWIYKLPYSILALYNNTMSQYEYYLYILRIRDVPMTRQYETITQ